uniref:Uncharacterized protein n=1 Tax=Arundo donax TaxID=35708 RepID=A0A0A9CPM4_ARUDO
MEAGLSAWQQITRSLFMVTFTDKHSSFPLCPDLTSCVNRIHLLVNSAREEVASTTWSCKFKFKGGESSFVLSIIKLQSD